MAVKNLSKEDIVKAMLQLNAEDYMSVMCTLAKENPYPEHAAYITNKFQQHRKKNKIGSNGNDTAKTGTSSMSAEEQMSHAVELFKRPEPPQLKLGRSGRSSRALESSPFASLLPDVHGASAWQVPILFRGDLVPKNGKLFLDVEKLSMKTTWNGGTPYSCKTKHKQVGNNVAIVDEKGLLVFWAFIYRDPNEICQYITSIHRINKAKVLGGVHIATVRDILSKCLKGNTLIGAALENDLKSLSLEEEFAENLPFMHYPSCDLQKFYVDKGGNPINLKDLVAHFFPDDGEHYDGKETLIIVIIGPTFPWTSYTYMFSVYGSNTKGKVPLFAKNSFRFNPRVMGWTGQMQGKLYIREQVALGTHRLQDSYEFKGHNIV